MIDPLSRIPNAQKATSHDERRISAQEGREQRQMCGQNRDPLDKNNDFILSVESQRSTPSIATVLRSFDLP
jgi:hypothetical protein